MRQAFLLLLLIGSVVTFTHSLARWDAARQVERSEQRMLERIITSERAANAAGRDNERRYQLVADLIQEIGHDMAARELKAEARF